MSDEPCDRCELCDADDSTCERCQECDRDCCLDNCIVAMDCDMNEEPWVVCEECWGKIKEGEG